MKCLHCDGEKFEEKNLRFTPEVKGEEVEVVVRSFICMDCKSPLMDTEQMNALRRAAADAYRKAHNLLTSEEIIAFRNMLGMSQTEFANYLKVGEASIKRWETYYVQDVVQNDHIRLKCDEAYAEFNALEVHWKNRLPDIFSGNRRFSLEFFKKVACYLVEFAKSPLYLNKALFYVDFLHFKNYGKGITGARYIPLEYGPCPDQYQNLFQLFRKQGVFISAGHHKIKSTVKADLNVFDDAEKETLKYVANLIKEDGGKHLFDLSHEEKAYKNTDHFQFISYEFAKDLKI